MDDVCIVSCHYNEDLTWLHNQSKYKYIVYSKTNPEYNYIPQNVGAEAEAYLQYIIDYYYYLPNTLIFIHGHEMAYHQDTSIMNLLNMLDVKKYMFHSLNNIWVCMVCNMETDYTIVNNILRRRLHKLNGVYNCTPDNNCIYVNTKLFQDVCNIFNLPVPTYFYSCHGAQFVVHKDLITQYPFNCWKKLQEYMYNLAKYHDSKLIGILMEVLWFYIFTKHYDEELYMIEKKDIF
jgi:hypothetical protein